MVCKISCILPVFNVEKYLKECLNSILNQSFNDIEIICINDGSTDNSLRILEEYSKNDERIKIINQENKGQGAARNIGIKSASGEYLCFIDPDDYLLEFALEKMYSCTAQSPDIVEAEYDTYHENEKKMKHAKYGEKLKRYGGFDPFCKVYSYKDFKKSPFKAFRVAVWAKLFKTSFIKNNNIYFPNTKMSEDNLFSYKALFLANKIVFTGHRSYVYRVRNGSSLDLKSDINLCIFNLIEEINKFLDESNLLEKYKKQFKDFTVEILCRHYQRTPDDKIEYFKKEAEKILKADYKKFLRLCKTAPKTFLERIFSVKNRKIEGKKIKEITILFLTFFVNKR